MCAPCCPALPAQRRWQPSSGRQGREYGVAGIRQRAAGTGPQRLRLPGPVGVHLAECMTRIQPDTREPGVLDAVPPSGDDRRGIIAPVAGGQPRGTELLTHRGALVALEESLRARARKGVDPASQVGVFNPYEQRMSGEVGIVGGVERTALGGSNRRPDPCPLRVHLGDRERACRGAAGAGALARSGIQGRGRGRGASSGEGHRQCGEQDRQDRGTHGWTISEHR